MNDYRSWGVFLQNLYKGLGEMNNQDKTEEQLTGELAELRRQIDELKASQIQSEQSGFSRGLRIGEILLEMGCLAGSQLLDGLKRQQEMRPVREQKLGEIMVESNFVTEREVASALEEQKRRLNAVSRSGAIFLGLRRHIDGIADQLNNILVEILGSISVVRVDVETGRETQTVIQELNEAEKTCKLAGELTRRLKRLTTRLSDLGSPNARNLGSPSAKKAER